MQAPTAGARAEEQGEEVEEVEEEAVAASELGTRSYWRNTYEQELASFVESSGSDAGEVWFGEGTQATVVAFAAAVVDAHGAAPRASARVLDLGCGNGALCVALARAGFLRVRGVDYAAPAIPLARAVAEAAGQPGLQFAVADLLAPFPPPPGGAPSFLAAGCADLLVDKGTLDAVGLSAGGAGARRRYAWAAARLLSPRGLLVLTSCNSTADELADEFCCAEAGWAEVGRVRTYPTFSFGGRTGARVATLALRRPAGGDDAA